MTPWLRIELSSLPSDTYASSRVPAVLAETAAARVTWWTNQAPGRTDLPRRVRGPDGDDFPTLGVYELDAPPTRMTATDDTVGLTFRRYPRPAQGRLTGRPTRGLQLVLIHPRSPEGAQALRDWGDFVHLRHIAEAACPGFTIITPYERAEAERTSDGPRFMHLYELDTDDPEPAFQAMTPAVAARLGGRDSEAFRRWAWHDELVIDYVNTFAYAGESVPSTTSSST